LSLLLDENLSPRLVERLSALFPGITHVRQVGLRQATDPEIWRYAQQNRFDIVTADGDFLAILKMFGSPPRVIFLQRCDYPARVIEDLLRRNAVRIAEFQQKPDTGLLAIRPQG
jgi:predicted nuclease of predicted toxin-antitoxin system